MRIISKQRDYYDGFQNHNKKDRFNKVYVRKEKEIKINMQDIKEIEDRYVHLRKTKWEAAFLILCGNVVPFITKEKYGYFTSSGKYINTKQISYFNAEDAWKMYNKSRENYPFYFNHPSKKDFVEFFKPYQKLEQLNIEHETPIILVRPMLKYYGIENKNYERAFVDVNLEHWGFTKYLDAHKMYQEIDVFISNVLVNDEMPETKMTEKQKMQQHGFTDEYSFRKRPSKKK